MSEITAIQNIAAKSASLELEQISAKPKTEIVAQAEKSFSKLVSSTKSDETITNRVTDKVNDAAKIRQKFESMVASQLFGTMLKSMPGDSFGTGMAGDIYKSMFADALGEQIAKHGGLGIAGLVLDDSVSRMPK